ncbi:MAG: alpha-glucoside-specific PTS transporter subunit IIBC [Atopobiaceae bacterium]|jgi:PTS system arbutin-like IIC component|nr:alpha-glucoside-specific PTS transporter subunit IIBC [Atopobiaceae bacterium]MCI2174117.1 alpha-glucoside-specific PTS transporter subunit IIBC [Atopobiaceae bacterium]MCI2206758.1 alpha-glucoside-specific PTS transporter subunit IIBC [Atopobiaceae bacterium]
MMQKIQKFGGAMFTPVLLFAFAGVVIGIGTLFTTEVIMGDIAAEGTVWYNCWNVILQGGWTVFNQLPLLFAVALPIGLAKKQNARCCMEVLVAYLTFNYFVNAILTAWGPELGVDFTAEVGNSSGLANIAGIKTLDMGMIGALAISGITIYLHNRFFDTELPDWLGVFSGSTFVYMIAFFVMIPVAVIACFVWPQVQVGMHAFQGFITTTGAFGVFVFIFLERALIPFGLHHLLYAPFYYDNVVVEGGIYAAFAKQLPQIAASTDSLKDLAPYAAYTATGWSKIFGCPGIALAFYFTAKPERKKELLALLIPITLTAILCGVTEPIEFTFLFIAPPLFIVHALLAACLSTCMYLAGVVGVFSGGLIEMSSLNFIPLMASHGMTYLVALGIGLCFTAIYFLVFRFLILKFDFKTPGREDDEAEIEFKSKKQYMESKAEGKTAAEVAVDPDMADKKMILAQNVLDGLGGPDNIVDVTNCATRLRVNVRDETLVAEDKDFKAMGAMGISKNGKAMQVIIGLSVPQVRERFETLL